jgi:hypothetical protein
MGRGENPGPGLGLGTSGLIRKGKGHKQSKNEAVPIVSEEVCQERNGLGETLERATKGSLLWQNGDWSRKRATSCFYFHNRSLASF